MSKTRQNIEIVRKGYNKIAKTYHNQRDKYKNSILFNKFSKLVPKDARVLDLGCGAGVPVTRFLSKRYTVTGIDFSTSMLKLAKKYVPKAHFRKIDITNMKFKPNSFDAAVSFYAIIHIPREKHVSIYKNLRKILKPGSILLINPTGSGNLKNDKAEYLGTQMFWSHYGPKKTLQIIKKSGFEILWNKLLKLGGEKQFWVLAKNRK